VAFNETVDLNNLPVTDLTSLSKTAEAFLRRAMLQNTTRASEKIWNEIVSGIKRRRPASAELIDALETARRQEPMQTSGNAFTTIAQEKDACGVALEIFGEDRATYIAHRKAPSKPAPFLQDLASVHIREDTMLMHDARVFPGWSEIRKYQVGAAEFEKNGEHLTILNVNRTPVERTLGVDLIYYQDRYDSYVLVQYKRMEPHHRSGWCFRPTDQQCKEELKRMQLFKKRFPPIDRALTLPSYRLKAEGFYFKLCREVSFKPLSDELIKGMYIPLDYWQLLLRDRATLWTGGGRIFHYENVGRHLSNTEFVNLVQQGWIGSSAGASRAITALIKQSISGNRSVIVGIQMSK